MSMAALFVASGFGAALVPSLGWLVVARAAAGFAIGVSTPTAGIYVAEVAPAAIRGRMLSIQLVAKTLGVILAYCVGLALVNAQSGWRFMFGFIALPAAIYGLALLPLMESPRWLLAVGQPSAAGRSLRRLFGTEADHELAAITAERAGADSDHGNTGGGRTRLWGPAHRPVVIVGLVVVFLSRIFGRKHGVVLCANHFGADRLHRHRRVIRRHTGARSGQSHHYPDRASHCSTERGANR